MEFGGSWSSFLCTYSPTVLYVAQICCTYAVKKKHKADPGHKKGRLDTHHGHTKGTHPRASQGSALRC